MTGTNSDDQYRLRILESSTSEEDVYSSCQLWYTTINSSMQCNLVRMTTTIPSTSSYYYRVEGITGPINTYYDSRYTSSKDNRASIGTITAVAVFSIQGDTHQPTAAYVYRDQDWFALTQGSFTTSQFGTSVQSVGMTFLPFCFSYLHQNFTSYSSLYNLYFYVEKSRYYWTKTIDSASQEVYSLLSTTIRESLLHSRVSMDGINSSIIYNTVVGDILTSTGCNITYKTSEISNYTTVSDYVAPFGSPRKISEDIYSINTWI